MIRLNTLDPDIYILSIIFYNFIILNQDKLASTAMSNSPGKTNVKHKNSIPNHLSPPEPSVLVNKLTKSSQEMEQNNLFSSNRLNYNKFRPKSIKKERISLKKSNKIITSDESTPGIQSNTYETNIYNSRKQANQQYFASQTYRPSNTRTNQDKKKSKSGSKREKSKDVSKLEELRGLVKKHESQLQKFRQSASKKEIHRLIKMQSTQKLMFIEQIKNEDLPNKQIKFKTIKNSQK